MPLTMCPRIGVFILMITNLFACSSRGCKTESLLDVLSDGHGAEDVEEDEAAVGHIVTQEIPVAQSLDPVDGGEGELGHHSAVEDGVEHGEEGGEGEPNRKH